VTLAVAVSLGGLMLGLGTGVLGWLLADARQASEVKVKLDAALTAIAKLETTLAATAAEQRRSSEDQGKRIGVIEERVAAIEAVDQERSRPHYARRKGDE